MGFKSGQLLARNYRLLQRLGKGALGEVWCARNETIDREVAIKFLMPSWPMEKNALASFVAEAKASGKIRHPSIVELLDLGETDDRVPFVVMELLEADKLSTVLESADSLPIGTSLRITAEIARAIQAAHEKALFHHHIEPANVLMHRDGRGVTIPKIVDFGIARLLDDRPQPKDAALRLGLVAYQSPEQARHHRPLDGDTDVWALGVLLHHCLIGAPPFRAANQEELLKAIEGERVAPNVVDPSIDPKVSDLVMDCLVTRPELRPSARALAERCEELLKGFDDHWKDLGNVLEIPVDRTIAHLSAIAPMKQVSVVSKPPDKAPTPAKIPTRPPPVPRFSQTLRPVALAPIAPPPPLDDEPAPLSSSSLEDAPPSSEGDDDAVPVSSSNLQEIPQPPPLASPMLLVTRSNAPPAEKAPEIVSKSTAPFFPPAPMMPKIESPAQAPTDDGPVSQLIAERFSKSTITGLDHDAMLDLESALLDRVSAERSSAPGAEPTKAPVEEKPAVERPSTPATAATPTIRAPRRPDKMRERWVLLALVASAVFAVVAISYRSTHPEPDAPNLPAASASETASTEPSTPPSTSVTATIEPTTPPSTSVTATIEPTTPPSTSVTATIEPTAPPSTSVTATAPPVVATTPKPPPTATTPPVIPTTPPVATTAKPVVTAKPKPTDDPNFGVKDPGI